MGLSWALPLWPYCAGNAVRDGNRAGGQCGWASALASAVSVHYYAVLIFLPLAVAEAGRWWLQGKPSWPVWVAFLVGALPLIAYLPLIRSATTYSRNVLGMPTIGAINDFFAVMLIPALAPFMAIAVWIVCRWLVFTLRAIVRGTSL